MNAFFQQVTAETSCNDVRPVAIMQLSRAECFKSGQPVSDNTPATGKAVDKQVALAYPGPDTGVLMFGSSETR